MATVQASETHSSRSQLDFQLRFDGSDQDRIRQYGEAHGLDAATQALYEAVRKSCRHQDAIEQIDGFCEKDQSHKTTSEQCPLFVVVPGFLHKEYPSSGADGRMLIEAAQQRGWPVEVIPVTSTGRLTDNANTIIQWLQAHADRPIVMASISKGSSDIVAALSDPRADQAFANVVGWVNVCGIIHGSPVVDAISRKKLLMLFFRAMFAVRGWCFASVTDLAYKRGPLGDELTLPASIKTVHAVGFPLEDDFVHSRLRKFRNLVGEAGPNDGAILLLDSILAPGVVYPVQGADHYMRPRHQMQRLLQGLLDYVTSDWQEPDHA